MDSFPTREESGLLTFAKKLGGFHLSNTNPYSPPESPSEPPTALSNPNELFIQVRRTWIKLGIADQCELNKTWYVGVDEIDPLAWDRICNAFKYGGKVRIKVNGRAADRFVEVNRGAEDEYLMWFMV